MKIKNLPKKIYLNICSNEDEVDYNELDGVTFSTEKVGVTDCDTENVPYVNAASLWHDLKEDKPPLRKWVMFRYSAIISLFINPGKESSQAHQQFFRCLPAMASSPYP